MSAKFHSPRSLVEALDRLAAEPGARPIAGCTDVMVAGGTAAEPAAVIDLLQVPELAGIRTDGETIDVGATTTFTALRQHGGLARLLPSVPGMAGMIGGWQIQNRATVGGNIANASPAGDSLPVWLALDAVVVVAGPQGRREVPYQDMHVAYRRTVLAPGEVVERLRIPRPEPGTIHWFRKVGTRQAQAISKVVIAGALRLTDGVVRSARLAAGSVAAVPVRLQVVERFLEGRSLSADVAEEAGRLAAQSVTPIDDVRSTAAYRRHVLGRLIRRGVLDLMSRDAHPTP